MDISTATKERQTMQNYLCGIVYLFFLLFLSFVGEVSGFTRPTAQLHFSLSVEGRLASSVVGLEVSKVTSS